MAREQVAGQRLVPRLAGAHDRLVLLCADLPAARVLAAHRHVAVAVAAGHHHADLVAQRSLAALHKLGVEGAVGALPVGHPPPPRGGLHLLEQLTQLRQVGVRHGGIVSAIPTDSSRIGSSTQRPGRSGRTRARAGAGSGATRPALPPPAAAAPPARRRAEPEPSRQLDLRQLRPGRDLAGDDQHPQPLHRTVHRVAHTQSL